VSGRGVLPAGAIPPLVTPFTGDGALDLPAFEANLDAYAAFDLGGYLVLGSNGEAASLAEDEKVALVRATRRAAGTRPVLAGTGLESTRATIELTRKAADAGADVALVLTPHYYKPQMTAAALGAHFEAVADASPIPVMLYSVPVFTSLPFPAELVAMTGGHPRVAGMKESSGDLGLLGRILALAPPSFRVACGAATVLYPALCLGAHAGIVALACCAPAAAAALVRAFAAGDHAAARRIQAAVAPLATAVTTTYGVAGLKRAMDLAGFRGGDVRAPLQPASADIDPLLDRLLAQANDAR
jgi:4-hydroxy-2-oxoglutarate aldolase